MENKVSRQTRRWQERHPNRVNPNQTPPPITDEQRKAFAEAMAEEHTITFTKGELICIFNALGVDDHGEPRRFRLGDANVLYPAYLKIQAIVAVDSNITKKAEAAEAIHLGKKANA